jgi:deazaflavin-dependent oxidoreductase (nitroreductase family)
MRKAFASIWAVVGLTGLFVAWWRRHPRFGADWVTRVVDPWLVRQGVIAGSKGELGLLEHVGRKSGTVRVTPIRPVPTTDGFRIVVPLGVASQWAQNVLAAGHCRLQVGDDVHELDEPLLVMPSRVDGLPKPAARVMDWLGFRYLVLRRFGEHPGTLEPEHVESEPEPREAVLTA